MSRAAILIQVCDLLARGEKLAAGAHLAEHYPPPSGQTTRRSWPVARAMKLFVRDGFTDRYSGSQLVFPGTLRALSLLLPSEFPYQRNWKQSQTHAAFWELYPTIDHVVPLARGGADDEANAVTTSMVRNAAKGNWLLEELGWPTALAPRVDGWDGLLSWFLEVFDHYEIIRTDRPARIWHKVAKLAT